MRDLTDRLPLPPPKPQHVSLSDRPDSLPRRLLQLTALFLLFLAVCEGRLAVLAMDTDAYRAVQQQSLWMQQLTDGRGEILDHDLAPLTGTDTVPVAAVLQGRRDYTALFDAADEEARARLYAGMDGAAPFLIRLNETADGAFLCPQRYANDPLAVHVIGYRSADGIGLTGAERAFNDYLDGGGDVLTVRCTTDALSQARTEAELRRTQGSGNALQLTLSTPIQRICEDVARQQLPTGAIVVMECATGRVKACVSTPVYDPNDVQKSIEAKDSALVNRAFSSFNVGSVYKPLLAALALEQPDFDPEAEYECSGCIEVDGHVYHCAHTGGHGTVDLQTALEVSCNCYFIQLGLQLPVQDIVDLSAALGLGSATPLGGGWMAGSGNLPDADVLAAAGELATLSFGQGQLTATPLQMAAAFNAVANDGIYISPTLAEGLVNNNTKEITESLYRPIQLRAMREETAEALRGLLTGVVENGLGSGAAIPEAAVAGKTGTAQTGRIAKAADGSRHELYDSWFVGFYPADAPRYTIAVLQDSTTVTGEDVAPVFAAVCRQLYYLEH